MMPIAFTSSAFAPIERLAGWLQPLARANPATASCSRSSPAPTRAGGQRCLTRPAPTVAGTGLVLPYWPGCGRAERGGAPSAPCKWRGGGLTRMEFHRHTAAQSPRPVARPARLRPDPLELGDILWRHDALRGINAPDVCEPGSPRPAAQLPTGSRRMERVTDAARLRRRDGPPDPRDLHLAQSAVLARRRQDHRLPRLRIQQPALRHRRFPVGTVTPTRLPSSSAPR